MAEQSPSFQFEDMPLDEARRMGRGPRMEPMLYDTLRQKIRSLSTEATRSTGPIRRVFTDSAPYRKTVARGGFLAPGSRTHVTPCKVSERSVRLGHSLISSLVNGLRQNGSNFSRIPRSVSF
jgi:hypothetical protein